MISSASGEMRSIRHHPFRLLLRNPGGMLITEKYGGIRIYRNGALDPRPLSGTPRPSCYPFRAYLDGHQLLDGRVIFQARAGLN